MWLAMDAIQHIVQGLLIWGLPEGRKIVGLIIAPGAGRVTPVFLIVNRDGA